MIIFSAMSETPCKPNLVATSLSLMQEFSQIFEDPLFSCSSENSTFGPKLFINISSKNRAVSQVNSTICHFGWRTTFRQHLSSAQVYPLLRTLVLAPVIIALGTYVATNCILHLTNSFSSSGHPVSFFVLKI